jgi:hypothetical protein
MAETKPPQKQPFDAPAPARPDGTMKKEHRMEARAPDPDDLTSEEPATPSAIQAASGGEPPKDVSAPHIPPVED